VVAFEKGVLFQHKLRTTPGLTHGTRVNPILVYIYTYIYIYIYIYIYLYIYIYIYLVYVGLSRSMLAPFVKVEFPLGDRVNPPKITG